VALILLSGRPGSGKTSYGSWLAEQRGFVHIDTDFRWTEWGPLICVENLDQAVMTRNRTRALGPDVIIEWGFRPALLRCVRLLRSAGFDSWWLDGDEAGSRHGFMTREGDSEEVVAAYTAQVDAIEAARTKLEKFYGDHIINAVSAGPTYMPFEQVASIMLPGTAQ
jgi:hypothetical protein